MMKQLHIHLHFAIVREDAIFGHKHETQTLGAFCIPTDTCEFIKQNTACLPWYIVVYNFKRATGVRASHFAGALGWIV